ncbi:MAG: hypothetical protein ABEJ59_04485 [Halanaeroarchaeum sp.]
MARLALHVAVGLVFGLLLGIVGGFRMFAPALLVRSGTTTSALGWIVAAIGVVDSLVSPVAATVAGYWLGGRTDLARSWSSVLVGVGIGGFAGIVVGEAIPVAVAVLTDGVLSSATVRTGFFLGWEAVVGGATLALFAFAGAAVRSFRRAEPPPA